MYLRSLSLITCISNPLDAALVAYCVAAQRLIPKESWNSRPEHYLVYQSHNARAAASEISHRLAVNGSETIQKDIDHLRELYLQSAHERAYLTALSGSLKECAISLLTAVRAVLPSLPRTSHSHVSDSQRITMNNVIVAVQMLKSLKEAQTTVAQVISDYPQAVGAASAATDILLQVFRSAVDELN